MATTLPWFICDCPGFSTENLASQETLSAMSWKTPQLWANLCWWSGFPDSSVGKQSVCNARNPGSIPGSGRSTGERTGHTLQYSSASLVAQLVKNPSTMRATCVRPLGWEDPLEKGKATHSSILAWRIPWLYSPRGHKESDTTEWLSLHSLGSTPILIASSLNKNYFFFCLEF